MVSFEHTARERWQQEGYNQALEDSASKAVRVSDRVMAGTELHELWISLNVSTEDMYKIAEAQDRVSCTATRDKIFEMVRAQRLLCPQCQQALEDW